MIRDHVGYDVRSLQEFMAARAITTGPDADVIRRLEVLAPASHWRNTWLLAAGRVFTEREHLRQNLVGVLESIDLESELFRLVAPGSRLAGELLEDDVASKVPKFQRQIAKHALAALNQPPSPALVRLAEDLVPAFEDPELVGLVKQELDRAVNSSDWRLLSSIRLLARWQAAPNKLTAWARIRLRKVEQALRDGDAIPSALAEDIPNLLRDMDRRGYAIRGDTKLVWQVVRDALATPVSDEARRTVRSQIDAVVSERRPHAAEVFVYSFLSIITEAGDRGPRDAAGSDRTRQAALELGRLADELSLDQWRVAIMLQAAVEQWLSQQPVAAAVGDLIDGYKPGSE